MARLFRVEYGRRYDAFWERGEFSKRAHCWLPQACRQGALPNSDEVSVNPLPIRARQYAAVSGRRIYAGWCRLCCSPEVKTPMTLGPIQLHMPGVPSAPIFGNARRNAAVAPSRLRRAVTPPPPRRVAVAARAQTRAEGADPVATPKQAQKHPRLSWLRQRPPNRPPRLRLPFRWRLYAQLRHFFRCSARRGIGGRTPPDEAKTSEPLKQQAAKKQAEPPDR